MIATATTAVTADVPLLRSIIMEVESDLRALINDLDDEELTFDWERRIDAQQQLRETINKLKRI
jgi:hypothetical protein